MDSQVRGMQSQSGRLCGPCVVAITDQAGVHVGRGAAREATIHSETRASVQHS